jgi:hypothetical protein
MVDMEYVLLSAKQISAISLLTIGDTSLGSA